ncbi:MAG: hypothetical protein WCP39_06080 [Chlamydiota bacterium]
MSTSTSSSSVNDNHFIWGSDGIWGYYTFKGAIQRLPNGQTLTKILEQWEAFNTKYSTLEISLTHQEKLQRLAKEILLLKSTATSVTSSGPFPSSSAPATPLQAHIVPPPKLTGTATNAQGPSLTLNPAFLGLPPQKTASSSSTTIEENLNERIMGWYKTYSPVLKNPNTENIKAARYEYLNILHSYELLPENQKVLLSNSIPHLKRTMEKINTLEENLKAQDNLSKTDTSLHSPLFERIKTWIDNYKSILENPNTENIEAALQEYREFYKEAVLMPSESRRIFIHHEGNLMNPIREAINMAQEKLSQTSSSSSTTSSPKPLAEQTPPPSSSTPGTPTPEPRLSQTLYPSLPGLSLQETGSSSSTTSSAQHTSEPKDDLSALREAFSNDREVLDDLEAQQELFQPYAPANPAPQQAPANPAPTISFIGRFFGGGL